MKKLFSFKNICWSMGATVLLIAFNNCGEGFVASNLRSMSSGGGAVFFSRAPGESCEDALLKVYANTYHPFLSQTCNSCHINGPGIGVFASPDVPTSYTAFATAGVEKISSQAMNDAHKPPFTGSHNTARITELKSYWGAAQTDYASCVAVSGGGANTGDGIVKTTSKAVAANLNTTFVRMEWDLETQSSNKVPLIAGIDIRRAVIGGVTQGYEFRNPTLRLKNAAAGNFQVRAVHVYINEEMQAEVTTYSNIDLIVAATTDLNLSPGTANALAVRTPASTDMISIEYSKLAPTTAVPTTPTPVPTSTPVNTPTPTPIGPVTYAQLAANGGLFNANCFGCHSGANAAGALDLTVYDNAKTAAQNIKARVNNALNPMPKGGLLPQNQRDIISAWVDQGAPQ